MSYKIFKSTPETMYNVASSLNVDIKPTGLEFVNLSVGDLIEPGDTFQITLGDNDPFLDFDSQLYIIEDKFNSKSAADSCSYILPFFVSSSERSVSQTIYNCTKVYKGYLKVPGVFEGETL